MNKVNPVVLFFFYIPVIGFTVFFTDVYFVALSFITASVNYVATRGRGAVKTILGLGVFALIITIINMALSRDLRPGYGLCLGFLFSAVLLWFFSFSRMMTTDKLSYLTKRMGPKFSVLCVLIFRLLPLIRERIKQILTAQKSLDETGKIKTGVDTISTLVNWSLEDGVSLGENMEARGYGNVNATSYNTIRFRPEDMALIIFFSGLSALVIAAYAVGMRVPAMTGFFILAIWPFATCVLEEIRWNILKSRI